MITYVLSRVSRILHEAISAVANAPRVALSRTAYLVQVDGTLHRVRRDRVCDCGGTPQFPCPAMPLVQDYLAAGGPRPLGRHESTWPEVWTSVPVLCPICDCPTVADRHLDSSHGPGWRCTVDASHYWWVRLNPLRRCLATRSQTLCYPWHDTPVPERQAWLEAHGHPPRLAASLPTEVAP